MRRTAAHVSMVEYGAPGRIFQAAWASISLYVGLDAVMGHAKSCRKAVRDMIAANSDDLANRHRPAENCDATSKAERLLCTKTLTSKTLIRQGAAPADKSRNSNGPARCGGDGLRTNDADGLIELFSDHILQIYQAASQNSNDR